MLMTAILERWHCDFNGDLAHVAPEARQGRAHRTLEPPRRVEDF